jgi:hypothetical protein
MKIMTTVFILILIILIAAIGTHRQSTPSPTPSYCTLSGKQPRFTPVKISSYRTIGSRGGRKRARRVDNVRSTAKRRFPEGEESG